MRLHGWMKTYKNFLVPIYVNKMYILLCIPFHKNPVVKWAWLGAILGCVAFWEVSRKWCEWGQNTLKWFELVCGECQQYLKLHGIIQVVLIFVVVYQIFHRVILFEIYSVIFNKTKFSCHCIFLVLFLKRCFRNIWGIPIIEIFLNKALPPFLSILFNKIWDNKVSHTQIFHTSYMRIILLTFPIHHLKPPLTTIREIWTISHVKSWLWPNLPPIKYLVG